MPELGFFDRPPWSVGMERAQLLKVMVPVAAFALMLILVGVVIALNAGDPTPTSTAVVTLPTDDDSIAARATPGDAVLGTVPMDDSGMSDGMPPLSAEEWKDAGIPSVPGLKIWDVKEGTEDYSPVKQDKVMVHYKGWLTNGSSFDSSMKHGGPSDFGLTSVIRGWTEGIPGMKIGGIRRLYIPARFAYGASGRPGIPPNSDLVFEVKLLRIFRAQ